MAKNKKKKRRGQGGRTPPKEEGKEGRRTNRGSGSAAAQVGRWHGFPSLIVERVAHSASEVDGYNLLLINPRSTKTLELELGQQVSIFRTIESSPKFIGIFNAWPHPRITPGKARLQLFTAPPTHLQSGAKIELSTTQSAVKPAAAVTLRVRSKEKADWMSGDCLPYILHYIKRSLTTVPIAHGLELSLRISGRFQTLEIHSITASRPKPKPSSIDPNLTNQDNKKSFPMPTCPPLFSVSTSTQVIFLPSPGKGKYRGLTRGTGGGSAEDEKGGDGGGFKAIGGLKREIRLIREVVEAPLKAPKLFSSLGIRAPKGVLMYGPPGTGKTMVARAIATEVKARFFTVNSPEIVGRFVGDAEARLSRIFTEATRSAPSVVFFDEIDAICPNRDSASSAHSQRLVACLLTLLDGVQADSRVVVLAATNRPNALDPALRRPGRLDREVHIGIPNDTARLDILAKTLQDMPHNLTLTQIKDCAKIAHGYVGADIRSLCQEAAFSALRRNRAGVTEGKEGKIGMGDFKAAFKRVQPSAMREVAIDVPDVRWTDIGGQEATKKRLQEAVEWPLRRPEVFKRMGIRPPKGILLYGPPGCSKTLMAKALATESSRNFIAVKGPELFSMYVGESERAVRSLFTKARAAAPAIVFFDEIDALAVARSSGSGSRARDRVLGQLLSELDGMQPLEQVVVIAATNRPDLLDPAMLRPGRIDRMLYVAPPDRESRESIARIHLSKIAHNKEVTAEFIGVRTEGFSGAEVVAVFQRAAAKAMEETTEAKRVEMRHFKQALDGFESRITPEMVSWYQSFESRSKGQGRRKVIAVEGIMTKENPLVPAGLGGARKSTD